MRMLEDSPQYASRSDSAFQLSVSLAKLPMSFGSLSPVRRFAVSIRRSVKMQKDLSLMKHLPSSSMRRAGSCTS